MGLQKKWTPEEVEFMYKYYHSHGVEYCAEHLGRTYNSVSRKANKLNIKVSLKLLIQNKPSLKAYYAEHFKKVLKPRIEDNKKLKTKEEKQEVIELYNSGLSCNQIAEKFNCSKGPVLEALKDVPKRSPGDYDQHFSKNQGFGETHHSWKGGMKSIYDRIRDLNSYWKWNKAVKERDFYSCRHCGVTEALEVHHIKTLKSLVMEYCENNNKLIKELAEEDLNSDYFYDINNGLTLCKFCHRKHHKENGR